MEHIYKKKMPVMHKSKINIQNLASCSWNMSANFIALIILSDGENCKLFIFLLLTLLQILSACGVRNLLAIS